MAFVRMALWMRIHVSGRKGNNNAGASAFDSRF
jgi:hypothetical protein